ncbi:MAG TPA: thermonuclease family protein [Candidatus Omnitrophota bacterium]|nr:thermonuclease family protein [Candidatus Omnitrophota bacterium]
MKKRIFIFLFLLLASTSFADRVKVQGIIKGDILQLEDGQSVRLIGINALEDLIFKNASRRYERTEATDFVKSLKLEGKELRLEYDNKAEDDFKRTYAYVYLKVCNGNCINSAKEGEYFVELDDGTYNFLNATLLKSGYAEPIPVRPNTKYLKLFQELFVEARNNNRGIWK